MNDIYAPWYAPVGLNRGIVTKMVEPSRGYETKTEDFICTFGGDGVKRGSKVETLPVGKSICDMADLEYFHHKVWRSFALPKSYTEPNVILSGGSDSSGAVPHFRPLVVGDLREEIKRDFQRLADTANYNRAMKVVSAY